MSTTQSTSAPASVNTTGADPVTNMEQAARWTAQANKLLSDNYLVRYNNWLLNKDVRKGLNLPPEVEPEAPFKILFAWVEGQGEVMSVSEERVATPPPPSPRITELGKIDSVVGAEVLPAYPGHYYNLSGATSEGTPHVSAGPPPRFWTLVAPETRSFARHWVEVKLGT